MPGLSWWRNSPRWSWKRSPVPGWVKVRATGSKGTSMVGEEEAED
jgi:hypothetical protein